MTDVIRLLSGPRSLWATSTWIHAMTHAFARVSTARLAGSARHARLYRAVPLVDVYRRLRQRHLEERAHGAAHIGGRIDQPLKLDAIPRSVEQAAE